MCAMCFWMFLIWNYNFLKFLNVTSVTKKKSTNNIQHDINNGHQKRYQLGTPDCEPHKFSGGLEIHDMQSNSIKWSFRCNPTHSIHFNSSLLQVLSNDIGMSPEVFTAFAATSVASVAGRPLVAWRRPLVEDQLERTWETMSMSKHGSRMIADFRVHTEDHQDTSRATGKVLALTKHGKTTSKKPKMFICHLTLPDPLRPSAITTFKTSNAKWRHSVFTSAKENWDTQQGMNTSIGAPFLTFSKKSHHHQS